MPSSRSNMQAAFVRPWYKFPKSRLPQLAEDSRVRASDAFPPKTLLGFGFRVSDKVSPRATNIPNVGNTKVPTRVLFVDLKDTVEDAVWGLGPRFLGLVPQEKSRRTRGC